MVQEEDGQQGGSEVVADGAPEALLQQAFAGTLASGLTNGLKPSEASIDGTDQLAASMAAATAAAAAANGEAQPGANGAHTVGKGKPKPPRPDNMEPCPRCGSMDTKFCYYNNYNVKQPRYYCKGCQRYWTAGGTLRNVPVGSGRRKSKSAAAKEQEKSQALAEQLAKHSVASAMLPGLAAAAAAPFLNPMLDTTVLAYNVAQQQLLGTAALGSAAALNALTNVPNLSSQWPTSSVGGLGGGVTGGLDSGSVLPATSAGNGTGQASGGDDLSQEGQPLSKRARVDSGGKLDEAGGALGVPTTTSLPATTTDDAGTSSTPSAGAATVNGLSMGMGNMSNGLLSNGANGSHNSLLPGSTNGLLSPVNTSWPMLGSDPSMMAAAQAAQAAAAHSTQDLLQRHQLSPQAAAIQQHLAYQSMMQASLLQHQLAAQSAAAVNPYALSLPHLGGGFNPYSYAALASTFNQPGR